MRGTTFGCLLLLLLPSCSGHTQEVLSPRHIETPDFPALAYQARVMGKVKLTLTIDADGNVKAVETTKDNSSNKTHEILEKSAIQNVQKWTFSRPSRAPFTQTIVYDYEFDETLPGTHGYRITKVDFDLPDRVKIVVNLPLVTS